MIYIFIYYLINFNLLVMNPIFNVCQYSAVSETINLLLKLVEQVRKSGKPGAAYSHHKVELIADMFIKLLLNINFNRSKVK